MFETFIKYYENLDININNNENNNQVAVIVEPRNHEYLIPIIKQVMSKIGNEWNLQIFGSSMNEKTVKEKIKGNYKFINMEINDLISPAAYSLLLQSSQFWNQIKEEHILIFQTDSFVININNDYRIPTNYPYLGARYRFHDNNGIRLDISNPIIGIDPMCGGFSYRKKSAMIDCINNVTYDNIIQYRASNNLPNYLFINKFIIPEDVFFENALTVLGYPSPLHTIQDEPSKFCVNHLHNIYNIHPLTAFSIHPFDRFNKETLDYICGELLKKHAINY